MVTHHVYMHLHDVYRGGAAHVQIHALVNVAGVDIIARLEDHSTARWDRVMAVNLRSVFLTCRAALPSLKAAQGSAIVNISSIQARRGFRQVSSAAVYRHVIPERVLVLLFHSMKFVVYTWTVAPLTVTFCFGIFPEDKGYKEKGRFSVAFAICWYLV